MRDPYTSREIATSAEAKQLHLLDPKRLTHAAVIGYIGGSVTLHEIAVHCQLNALPPIYLTEANLCVRNAGGCTTFHHAAEFGCLDQIPTNLLTLKNLLLTDRWINTPLSIAASFGKLDDIPITSEMPTRYPEIRAEIHKGLSPRTTANEHFSETDELFRQQAARWLTQIANRTLAGQQKHR